MTDSATQARLPLLQRLLHAAPDVITAGVFLVTWITPRHWRDGMVAELMLVMLVEFILIHSAPFLGSVVMASEMSLGKRLATLAGFALFYSLFIGAFAASFESWWPVMAFAWLIGAKVVAMVGGDRQSAGEVARMRGYWGLSALFYICTVMATLFIPLPRLGIIEHGHAYGIGGSGEWVSRPHIVVAAGFLYFSLLAFTKLTERPSWWQKMGLT
ncbi:MAG: hypothetical protein H6978_05290 [Gammaproteobacteria bacterium]|nr:hypothetical protein [Gammaproteobacteria bacterium]